MILLEFYCNLLNVNLSINSASLLEFFFISFAGTPPTIDLDGTFFTTELLDATIEPFPMLTPHLTEEFAAIHVPFCILTLPDIDPPNLTESSLNTCWRVLITT